jgi:hypothetical protein
MRRNRTPEVPAGTVLQLHARDWIGCGDHSHDGRTLVVLSGISPASGRWTWVIGHRPQCDYSFVEAHPPCLELLVLTTTLAAYEAPS